MKSIILLVAQFSFGVAVAAPQGMIGGLVTGVVNSGYGKVADVPGAAPRKVKVESRAKHLAGAQSIKIRYGPYKVPNGNKKNFMGESGTLYNYPDLKVEKPCEECIILGMSAGLEFPNGTDANTGNGLWLHHMVLLNQGPGRMDPTCVGKTSLPHMVVGSDPGHSERFFSSGNERTRVLFTPPFAPESKMGYFVNKADKFLFIVDLMNMNQVDHTVYMTITYDFIDGRPAGFDNMKAIWLDAAQCGTSEVIPPKQSGSYEVGALWVANIEGEILGAGGHVHDGGEWLSISVDGKTVCNSTATYGVGGKPMGGMAGMGPSMGAGKGPNTSRGKSAVAMLDGPEGHSHGGSGEHITAMSGCSGEQMGKFLKKGQRWTLKAHYDYDRHSGMKNAAGRQENVMAISIMYIKNPH